MKYRHVVTGDTVTLIDRSTSRVIVRDDTGSRIYLDPTDFNSQYTLIIRRHP